MTTESFAWTVGSCDFKLVTETYLIYARANWKYVVTLHKSAQERVARERACNYVKIPNPLEFTAHTNNSNTYAQLRVDMLLSMWPGVLFNTVQ